MAGLTEKRRRFVEAYVGEAAGNATQAARIAGYAGNQHTLESVASELLSFPVVRDAIAELTAKMSRSTIMGAVERQELLSRMARGELPVDGDIDPVALWAAQRSAVDLLNKMQGSYLERVELSGSVETTVRVYVPGNGRDKG